MISSLGSVQGFLKLLGLVNARLSLGSHPTHLVSHMRRHLSLRHQWLVAHQDRSVTALHHEIVLCRLSEVDKLLLVFHLVFYREKLGITVKDQNN